MYTTQGTYTAPSRCDMANVNDINYDKADMIMQMALLLA